MGFVPFVSICAQATVITKKVFDGPSTPAEAGRVGSSRSRHQSCHISADSMPLRQWRNSWNLSKNWRKLHLRKVTWKSKSGMDCTASSCDMLHFFHGSKGEKPTKLKVSWHLLAWDASDVLRSYTGLKHEAFQDARGWRMPRRPRLCRVMDTELTCLPRTSSKRWMATLMHWCTTKHLKPALCKHWISCDSSQHSKYVEFR